MTGDSGLCTKVDLEPFVNHDGTIISMKFAHEFKDALIREGFPSSWVESAIPYSQLKKVIKKVLIELQAIGLDPATLTQFKPDPNQVLHEGQRGSDERGLAYRYGFEGMSHTKYLSTMQRSEADGSIR